VSGKGDIGMFSGLIAVLSKFSLQARRSIRGAILIGWILLLIFFAGLAAAGKASEYVLSFIKQPVKFGVAVTVTTPREHLEAYLAHYEYPPPIEAFIDQMVSEPSWLERNLAKDFDKSHPGGSESKEEKRAWIQDQYFDLFGKIDSKLQALVSDRTLDIEHTPTIESPVIPAVFRKENKPGEAAVNTGPNIIITREVVAWIKDERLRKDATQQRYALVDTFFLLMVIGAFGSLIFLSKDFIERQEETSISSLIFRPILGMFLAMAVFIVSMFGHTVISTADILKIRTEPLYLLALAAGMLSEQAYELVKKSASAALDKLTEEEEPEERAENNSQPPHPPQT
jgi:hypothetical protein